MWVECLVATFLTQGLEGMTFLAKNLKMLGKPSSAKLPSLIGVPFGSIFTPHMMQADWKAASGWGDPRITDFGPLSLPPQAACLHYAVQCFEGMKAYKDAKGGTTGFQREM